MYVDERSEITEHHVAIENNLVRFVKDVLWQSFPDGVLFQQNERNPYSGMMAPTNQWTVQVRVWMVLQLKWLVNNGAFPWISESSSFPVGVNQWTMFQSWNTYMESQIFLWMQYGCLVWRMLASCSWGLVGWSRGSVGVSPSFRGHS